VGSLPRRKMAKETFEQALAKMEEIVRRMEAGDLTLEESLKAFEEGIRLSGICAKRLDEAERKVEILLKEGRGIAARPFQAEEKENG
jgi:exodeoxyribonuclease VII small subunit